MITADEFKKEAVVLIGRTKVMILSNKPIVEYNPMTFYDGTKVQDVELTDPRFSFITPLTKGLAALLDTGNVILDEDNFTLRIGFRNMNLYLLMTNLGFLVFSVRCFLAQKKADYRYELEFKKIQALDSKAQEVMKNVTTSAFRDLVLDWIFSNFDIEKENKI